MDDQKLPCIYQELRSQITMHDHKYFCATICTQPYCDLMFFLPDIIQRYQNGPRVIPEHFRWVCKQCCRNPLLIRRQQRLGPKNCWKRLLFENSVADQWATPDDMFNWVVGLEFSHCCHEQAPELLVVNLLPENSPFVTKRPVDRSFKGTGYLHFIYSDKTFPITCKWLVTL